jgi:hypothetical protein
MNEFAYGILFGVQASCNRLILHPLRFRRSRKKTKIEAAFRLTRALE